MATIFGVLAALVLVRQPSRQGDPNSLIDIPFAIHLPPVGLLAVLYGLRDTAVGYSGYLPARDPDHLRRRHQRHGLRLLLFGRPRGRSIPRDQGRAEQASDAFGANWWQTFRRVTLPAIRWEAGITAAGPDQPQGQVESGRGQRRLRQGDRGRDPAALRPRQQFENNGAMATPAPKPAGQPADPGPEGTWTGPWRRELMVDTTRTSTRRSVISRRSSTASRRRPRWPADRAGPSGSGNDPHGPSPGLEEAGLRHRARIEDVTHALSQDRGIGFVFQH